MESPYKKRFHALPTRLVSFHVWRLEGSASEGFLLRYLYRINKQPAKKMQKGGSNVMLKKTLPPSSSSLFTLLKKTLLCGQFLRLSEPSSSLFWTLNRLTPHFHNFFESLTAIITPILLHTVGRWGLRGKLLMIRIFQVEQKSLIVRESFACQTFFNFSLLPLLKYFKLTFLALN